MPIKELVKKAFEEILKHLKTQNTTWAIEVVEKTIEEVQKQDEPETPTGAPEAPTEEVPAVVPETPAEEKQDEAVTEEEKKTAEMVKKYVDMYISSYDLVALLEILKGIDLAKMKEVVENTATPAEAEKISELEKKVEKLSEWESKQVDVEKAQTSVFDWMFG